LFDPCVNLALYFFWPEEIGWDQSPPKCLRRVVAPERVALTTFLVVATAPVGGVILHFLVAIKLVQHFEIDVIGFQLVVVLKDAPQGGQSLLPVQQVLIHTGIDFRSRGQMPGNEFLLVANLQDQGDAQGQVVDHRFNETANAVAVPRLEALEARQLDLGPLNLAIPVGKLSVSCFHA
jgi:hypothetical protein